MEIKLLFATLLISLIHFNSCDESAASSASNDKVLSRRKRYLLFPEGASFSVATCMTVGIYGNPQYSMFSWGLNWGFAYELPTNASYYKLLVDEITGPSKRSIETRPMMQRRHRRDLYNRMEVAMKDMGYNGRDCILRALCESQQTFGRKGTHLIAELIRTVFAFPKSKVLSFEHPELMIYDEAYRLGKSVATECHAMYPNCGFSLIKLALGRYSKPLQNFM